MFKEVIETPRTPFRGYNSSMENKGWSNLVTRRASVMTPLLILNGLLLFFGTVDFLHSGSIWLYVFWILIAAFTLYKYERFSKKSPWLLSSQKVALKGMELFGDKERTFTPSEVVELNPVQNPQRKQISSRRGKK